jgi:hypothetical protein
VNAEIGAAIGPKIKHGVKRASSGDFMTNRTILRRGAFRHLERKRQATVHRVVYDPVLIAFIDNILDAVITVDWFVLS